jgi:hypothetical protein
MNLTGSELLVAFESLLVMGNINYLENLIAPQPTTPDRLLQSPTENPSTQTHHNLKTKQNNRSLSSDS